MAAGESEQSLLTRLAASLAVIDDFPKPGVRFLDITSVLLLPDLFQLIITAFANRYAGRGITHVVSVESRGFILASPLALALKVPFVPMRRARRLPDATVGVDVNSGPFSKYRLEVHSGVLGPGATTLLVDDVIGTGTTLLAAIELIRKCGAEVSECCCVAELAGLKGVDRVSSHVPVYCLIPSSLLPSAPTTLDG